MNDPKQKKQAVLLSVLVVALAFVLYYAFSGGTDSDSSRSLGRKLSSTNSNAEMKDLAIPRNPRRTGGKKEVLLKDVDPTIHLERLTQFNPGTPLNSRNMFSLEAPTTEIASTPLPRQPAKPRPVTSNDAGAESGMGAGRASAPPLVNINLKFIGFALNPVLKTRQGFFADGDEVYLASEGQLVANRYRVVRIGDASAEVEEVTSKTRRQISLVTQ